MLAVWLEADAPRVTCRQHGVVVAHVPWARHGAGHTAAFDDTVAWLATATSKSTVCQLLRVAWRTVGAIITRVADEAVRARDPLDGLRRIGNTKIRLLMRMAFGFKNTDALIALAMLALGGYRPDLPRAAQPPDPPTHPSGEPL